MKYQVSTICFLFGAGKAVFIRNHHWNHYVVSPSINTVAYETIPIIYSNNSEENYEIVRILVSYLPYY